MVNGEKTVPAGFIGPLPKGVTREAPKKVFVGPVRPGTDVELFRETGISRRIGEGSGPAKVRRVIEAERKRLAAIKEKSDRLAASLMAKAELAQLAISRGRPLTRLEFQTELKKRGTSITELRAATKASRKQFRETGISFEEQIRLQEEAKKLGVSVRDVRPDVISFGEVQAVPEPKGILEKGITFLQRERGKAFIERVKDEETFKTQFLGGFPGQTGRVGLEFVQFGKELVTKPIKTIKEIPGDIVTGIKGIPEIGKVIREEPGVAGAEILAFTIGLRGGSNLIKNVRSSSTTASNLVIKTKVPNKVSQSIDVSDAILIRTLPDGSKIFNVEGKVVTKVINAKTGRTINKLTTDTVSKVITSQNKQGAIVGFVEGVSQTISNTARRTSKFKPKVTISGRLDKTRGLVVFEPAKKKVVTGVGVFETTEIGKISGRLTPEALDIKVVRTRAPEVTKVKSILGVKALGEDFVIRKIKGVEVLGRRTKAEVAAFDVIFPQKIKVRGFTRVRPSKEGILGGIERVPTRVRKFPERKQIKVDIGQIIPGEPLDIFVSVAKKPPKIKEIGLERGIATAFEPKEIISNLNKLTEGVIKPSKKVKPVKEVKKPKPSGDILEQKLTTVDENLIGGALGQQFTGAVARQIKARAVEPKKLKVKAKTKDITRVDTTLETVAITALLPEQKLSLKELQRQKQELGFVRESAMITETGVLQQQDITQLQKVVPIQTRIQRISKALDFTKGFPRVSRPRGRARVVKKIILPPPIILPDFKDDPLVNKIKKSKKPHDVFVKTKGRRVKIADNIMGNIALDLGSNVADRSLAAEFSVKESKGKLKDPPFVPPKNYWEFNQNKFRGFRFKKGRKIPLKNVWIEKRNRRLDTIGERNQITVSRLLSQQKKVKSQRFNFNKGFDNIFGGIVINNPKPRKKKINKTSKGLNNIFGVGFNLS